MRTLLLALLFTLPGLSLAAAEHAESQMALLIKLLDGRYQSEALLDPLVDGPQLTDHRIRVHSPHLGDHVMYWQLNSGPEQQIYRQRLLVFSFDAESGHVRQQTFSLVDAQRFDATKNQTELFAGLSEADLVRELPAECDPMWQQVPEGWYGRTDPERCRIFSDRHQDWRHIEAELLLAIDGLRQAERGFDSAGNQLFGTAPGELFRLLRAEPAN